VRSRVYETDKSLSVSSIDNSSLGVRRVCCWTPRRQEISIDSRGDGAEQQMRAVSCGQPTGEAKHRFVLLINDHICSYLCTLPTLHISNSLICFRFVTVINLNNFICMLSECLCLILYLHLLGFYRLAVCFFYRIFYFISNVWIKVNNDISSHYKFIQNV